MYSMWQILSYKYKYKGEYYMRKKKLFLAGTMFVLSASALAGCDKIGGPKTAQDVIQKWQDKATVNYSLDGSVSAGIDVSADGMSLSIPVDFTMKGDVVDNSSHMDIAMNMEFMGKKVDLSAETYMDLGASTPIVYAQTVEDGEKSDWAYSEMESSDFDISSISNREIDLDLFADSTMSYDKESKTYTVVQPVKSIIESDNFQDIKDKLSESDITLDDTVSVDDVLDAFSAASVVYVFDSDFNLTELKTEDMVYSQTVESDGKSLDINVAVDVDIKFDNFGKFKVDDVEVPSDIKDSAVKAEDGDMDIPIGADDDVNTTEDDFETPETLDETTESVTETPTVGTVSNFGKITYNDTDISYGNVIPFSVFEQDGWVMDTTQDGEYTFVVCYNEKYPDMTLELYPAGGFVEKATIADINANGISGYAIEGYQTSAAPIISINGAKLGSATASDVIAIYGEPDYKSIDESGNGSVSYYNDTEDAELYMYFYEGVLDSFSVRSY